MKFVFLLGILFTMSLQPIFMVSVLIFMTFLYSYMIYNIMGSFWFSYILLMVMLSGVLVIFTYMVVLIPNEGFEVYNLVILFMFMMLIMMEFMNNYESDYSVVSVNLWVTYLGFMTLFMVGFLLMIMLLVVSLSYINDGALRIK